MFAAVCSSTCFVCVFALRLCRPQLHSIAAIVVMHDPVEWYRDLQICLDVLTCVRSAGLPPVKILFSNGDFLFSGGYSSPRLAQGAFRICLQALYKVTQHKRREIQIIAAESAWMIWRPPHFCCCRARSDLLGVHWPPSAIHDVGQTLPCHLRLRGEVAARTVRRPSTTAQRSESTCTPTRLTFLILLLSSVSFVLLELVFQAIV